MRVVTPGPFRRSLRRSRGGTEPGDVWASVDGMPAVVLTVPSPELFVLIDGLAVRATPDSDEARLVPGDTVQIRYDVDADAERNPAAARLVAS